MKKLFLLALAVILMASLAGCGNVQDAKETAAANTPAEMSNSASAAASVPIPTTESTPAPAIASTPAPTSTQEPTASPEPTPAPQSLEGIVIGIDPGHQGEQNSDPEPVSPGSDETKMKVTSGTSGVASGVDEHVVNLHVGLLLRDMLEAEGATVIMTRESADVDISNAERAQLFNENEVDLAIRLHCNGVDDADVRGAFMLVPESNPYKEQCDAAAKMILKKYIEATGLESLGITERSDQTGFNWCERPIVNIEMGHMSNVEEDLLLTDESFEQDMAQGLFDGITAYFEES